MPGFPLSKNSQSPPPLSKPSVQMLEIDGEQGGQRIDNFLLKLLKGVPKSHIYRILRKGEVRVNKGRVKAEYRLQAGDLVRVPPVRTSQNNDAQPNPSTQILDLIQSQVLHEDKDLFVINKPSGVAVHGGSGIQYGVIEAMRTLYPQLKNLELVHRLDRETSGCLIITKKNSALRNLHEQIRNHKVFKLYLALVKGRFHDHNRKADFPLLKNVQRSGERIVMVDPLGKPSQSIFSSLQTYEKSSLVKVQTITGRTHQIRVHAAHMGFPLAGDEKYGDGDFNREMRQLGLKRLFLHASEIRFISPATGLELCISAPLKGVLGDVLNQLESQTHA